MVEHSLWERDVAGSNPVIPIFKSLKMLYFFESPFIFSQNIEKHNQIKSQLLPKILEKYNKNKNNEEYLWKKNSETKMITSYHDTSIDLYDDFFYENVIFKPVNNLINQINLKVNSKCSLENIWWNVYQKNDYADVHNHGPEKLSGLYVLNLNEKNTTVFVTKNDLCLQTHETDYVKEGDVLLFPSSLLHYVRPSKSRRVTISFNILI